MGWETLVPPPYVDTGYLVASTSTSSGYDGRSPYATVGGGPTPSESALVRETRRRVGRAERRIEFDHLAYQAVGLFGSWIVLSILFGVPAILVVSGSAFAALVVALFGYQRAWRATGSKPSVRKITRAERDQIERLRTDRMMRNADRLLASLDPVFATSLGIDVFGAEPVGDNPFRDVPAAPYGGIVQ